MLIPFNIQSPKMMSANNIGAIFHPQFAGTISAGWKRPLDGPMSSLPLMAKTNLAREGGMMIGSNQKQQMANGNANRWQNGGSANSLLPSTKGSV